MISEGYVPNNLCSCCSPPPPRPQSRSGLLGGSPLGHQGGDSYRSDVPVGELCYWERLSGFGGDILEDVITNDAVDGPAQVLVEIDPTDAGLPLRTERIGVTTGSNFRTEIAYNCYETGTAPRMKKLLALSAVGVLAFAACGDDDDDGGSDTTDVETITSDVTEESVVSEESEVVEGTTVESEVTEESVVTEESIVVETEAGVGTEG